MELATEENTVFALEPISRTVPTTMTRITASITAYSAMSCPSSSRHLCINFIEPPLCLFRLFQIERDLVVLCAIVSRVCLGIIAQGHHPELWPDPKFARIPSSTLGHHTLPSG